MNPDPVAAGDEKKTGKPDKSGKTGKDKKADADASSKPAKDDTASATPAAPDPTAAQTSTSQGQSQAQAQPQTQTGAAIVVAAAVQGAVTPAPAVVATDKPAAKGKTPEVTAAAATDSVAKVEIAGGPAAKEPAPAASPVQTGQPAQDAATPDPTPQPTADGKPAPAPVVDGSQKADDQKSVAAARGEAPANAPRFTLPDPSGNAPANTQNANTQSAVNAAQTLSVPTPAGQPAAHAVATAAAPPPQAPAAPVPLAGVAVAIAARASAGTNHFAIRLDPPELGRIEVRLNVDKDGRITSHLVADRKDTLALLQRDVSGLQRTLQDAGFKTADNGLQFSLRDSGQQQQQQQQQQQSNGGNAGHLVLNDETGPAVEALPSGYGRYLGRAGGVDIRV